ncbi:MAG TPA: DUF6636 domain-containing protein [Gaiellaceae bacterium]
MARLLAVAVAVLAFAQPAGSATATVRWFHSPTGNIQCEVASRGPGGTFAFCQTFKAPRSATLRRDGRTRVCRGVGCLGNGPENAFTLRYGRSVTVGPFRCTSRRSGMRCIVRASGHGFAISRERLRVF